MARTQASHGLDVYQIFNLCQKSSSAHEKCRVLLWQLEKANSESCLQSVLTCIKHVLMIPSGSKHGTRVLGFVVGFIAGRDPAREAECDTFAEKLLSCLVSLVTVEDKIVRTQCCQLVSAIFRHMSADEIDDELLSKLEETMLLRLEDKVPDVRAHAVKALPRFCDPGDAHDYADDPLLETYLQLLAADRSKAVRKAVLWALPACDRMVEELMTRTRDVNHEVRKMAYIMMREKVEATYLSLDQRVELLRRGLGERAPIVQKEAIIMVQVWLEEERTCHWDPIKLLQLLDVQMHEDVAVLAVKALIAVKIDKLVGRRPDGSASGKVGFAIDPKAMALSAAKESRGLRQAPHADLLSSEEALLWKVVCIHLHTSGQEKREAAAALTGAPAATEAASADDHLKALEAALPPTTSQFMQLLAAHAAAGQQHSFATCQLLQLAATCMDMADTAGRQATTNLAQQLLRDPTRFESSNGRAAWASALLQLTRHVYASNAELADAMLCMLWDMFDGWGLAEGSQTYGEQENSMTGEAPDSLSFQGVLDQASQVRSQNQQWAHTLRVAGLLLQQLPSARLHTTGAGLFQCIDDLWPHLILPGLGHAVAAVRLEAMQTLGLYCLLEGIPRPEGQVATLRAGLVWQRPQTGLDAAEVEVEEAAIRVVAAKALCDWALIRGPKASDQWYLNQAPVVQDLQVSPPSSPQQKEELKPLLDLLLGTLQCTLQSDRQSMSRPADQAGTSDEEEELAGVLAEGVAKVLLHARIWSATTGKGLQEAEIAKALAVLLVAHFDPATQNRPRLRQCLSVFFPAYAAASSLHQHHLARAFRRAARGALGVAPVKKAPAPQIMRYMLQLLQILPAGTPKDESLEKEQPQVHASTKMSYHDLAAELVWEVAQCSRFKESKAYLAAILKVLPALPLDPTQHPAAIKTLRALVGQVSSLVKDRAAAKDLEAFAKHLEELDATPQQGLDTDALSQLMQSVSLHTQTTANTSERGTSAQTAPQEGTLAQRSPGEDMSSEAGPRVGSSMAGEDLLADCPLPFEDRGSGAVACTPARARRPAKRGPITDDASDTQSRVSVPSTAVRRQMPARSARTTKKLVEIVTSSESECTTSDDDSTDAEEDT